MFTPLPAGKRRSQITLASRNDAQNSVGQATGYTVYTTVRAYIETVRAQDALRGDVAVSELTHRINLRYQPGLTVHSKDRVLYAHGVPSGLPAGLSWPIANATSLTMQQLRALNAAGVRVFEVKAPVNPDERNVELDLLCLELGEGAPAGL